MNAGRGPRWGAYENYLSEANDALFTICQCETVEGLENIDKIAGTPGVDCVFIGTGDLSLDMGHPNDLKHPEVAEDVYKRQFLEFRAPNIPEKLLWQICSGFGNLSRFGRAARGRATSDIGIHFWLDETRDVYKRQQWICSSAGQRYFL